jgi:hypothetical protein
MHDLLARGKKNFTLHIHSGVYWERALPLMRLGMQLQDFETISQISSCQELSFSEEIWNRL